MSIIERTAQSTILRLAKSYPALVVTGPRQSGKTTLVRLTFPDKPYVSLEEIDNREFAQSDPRGFLNQYKMGAILDEVQRCPDLFSYLQSLLDNRKEMGLFILTGSQQFGLISKISQSLAGRVAKISLLPLSLYELQNAGKPPNTLEDLLFNGLYPAIYDRNLDPSIWHENYVDTYLERDVRQIINIRNLSSFQRFLRMCAARTGQILNLSSMAGDCGITHNTAKSWISVLEASYIVHLLSPHHKNFNKRLIKAPKLYFYDCGLATWLLGINSKRQLETHPMRGHLFETWAVSELIKYRFNNGSQSNLYFWRDNSGNEIDIIIDNSGKLDIVEVKSGQTIASDFLNGVKKFKELAGDDLGSSFLLYGGEIVQNRSNVSILPWDGIKSITAK